MTQLMSIRDKMILVRNAQLEIDKFFAEVIQDYVRRSVTFRNTGVFEEGDDKVYPFPYHFVCHNFPYYGTDPTFSITICRDNGKMHTFKVPSAILDSNNDGWCRDWRIVLSHFIHTEDLANGYDPIPYRVD